MYEVHTRARVCLHIFSAANEISKLKVHVRRTHEISDSTQTEDKEFDDKLYQSYEYENNH
jgi:hypothetical protein